MSRGSALVEKPVYWLASQLKFNCITYWEVDVLNVEFPNLAGRAPTWPYSRNCLPAVVRESYDTREHNYSDKY